MKKLFCVLIILQLFSIPLLPMEERAVDSMESNNSEQNSLDKNFANDDKVKSLLLQSVFVLAKEILGENFTKRISRPSSSEASVCKNFIEGLEIFIQNAADGSKYPIEDANSFYKQMIRLKNFKEQLRLQAGFESNIIFELMCKSLNKLYDYSSSIEELNKATPLVIAIIDQPEVVDVIFDIVDTKTQSEMLTTEVCEITPVRFSIELNRTDLFVKLFDMLNQVDKKKLLTEKFRCCNSLNCLPVIIFIRFLEDKVLLQKILVMLNNQVKKEIFSIQSGSIQETLLMEATELPDLDILRILLSSLDSYSLKECLKQKDYWGKNLLMYAAQRSVEAIKLILELIDDQFRCQLIEETDNGNQTALKLLLMSLRFSGPEAEKAQIIKLLTPKQ